MHKMDADKDCSGRKGRLPNGPIEQRVAFPQPLARGIFNPSAFTLIEILIAVGIIAVLVTMLLVTGPRIIASTHGAACASNLRGIHQALSLYAAENNNCLPPALASGTTWVLPLWPYLSQGNYATEASKRRGVTYCPATIMAPRGTGIYRRDRATWRTDYNVNPHIMSVTESANNLATISGQLVLAFDGGGGASGNSAVNGDSTASKRHNGRFNVLFMDGHVEMLTTFTNEHSNNFRKPL